MAQRKVLGDTEYARFLAFRVGLHRFVSWSAQQAATVGLTPAQHQLLLAIRGHADPRGPSVSDLADALGTRHHSAVQLLDRAEQLGLVTRSREDDQDRRVVRLALTEAGEHKLAQLSATHLEELHRLAPFIDTLVGLTAPQEGETVLAPPTPVKAEPSDPRLFPCNGLLPTGTHQCGTGEIDDRNDSTGAQT